MSIYLVHVWLSSVVRALLLLTCRRGALPALAALFTAPVERKALQHLHTHGGRDVCRERAVNRDMNMTQLKVLTKTKMMLLLNAEGPPLRLTRDVKPPQSATATNFLSNMNYNMSHFCSTHVICLFTMTTCLSASAR